MLQTRAGAARTTFGVADETTGRQMRRAAESLRDGIRDPSTALLLEANLFESRGFFGEASLRLLELLRRHPDNPYVRQRATRLSLYLE
jgi:hypothetical protein